MRLASPESGPPAGRRGLDAAAGASRALPARLDGRLLTAARVAWLALAVSLVALVTAGFVRAFDDPALIMLPPLETLFRAYGLNDRVMMAVALAAPYLTVVLISALVFARRSHDPMALLFTLTLLAGYSYTTRTLLTYADGTVFGAALSATFAMMLLGLALVLALFPDGRLVPRWAGLLVPLTVGLVVAFPDAGRVLMRLVDGEAGGTRPRVFVLVYALLLVIGLWAQASRYRRVSGPMQRQQTKWVMAPLGAFLLLSAATMTVNVVLPPDAAMRWAGWLLALAIPLGIIVPLAVANAVLRYRLYEIDRIISRTVSYTLVVIVLGAVYGIGVVSLGAAVSAVTGERSSELTVAVSVLVVAALFRPLRRRVQAAVDRRFHRTGHDARLVVESYIRQLRDEVDLPTICRELTVTASAAVKPAQVSVWLVDDPAVVPLPSSGER